MRKSFLILLFLVINYGLNAQYYSKLNLDKQIKEVISFEVDEIMKSSSDRNRGRKKINHRIIPWKDAIFYMTTYSHLFSYDDKTKKLTRNNIRKKGNEYSQLITDKDLEYMTKQIHSENQAIWNLTFEKGILRKNPNNKYYEYTIPIFDLSNKKAVIYKEFTCGSLCAYGSFEIYFEQDGKWTLYKTINIWIS